MIINCSDFGIGFSTGFGYELGSVEMNIGFWRGVVLVLSLVLVWIKKIYVMDEIGHGDGIYMIAERAIWMSWIKLIILREFLRG